MTPEEQNRIEIVYSTWHAIKKAFKLPLPTIVECFLETTKERVKK